MITLPNGLKSSFNIVTRKCSLWIAGATKKILNFKFFENIFLILQKIGEKDRKSDEKVQKKYGKNTEKVRQKYENVSKK